MTNRILVIACAGALVIGAADLAASYPRDTAGAETCFSAALWDAPASLRPCYRVTRPHEDGSGRLHVGTAARDLAVCRIPNVREERGTFAVRCRRIARDP